MARAYYNEIDPDAVHVLRALVADGVIAPGDVDDRSIKDVSPDDLRGYTQCHFFAGGGLWSVAARLAGWPDERPLWTGSCPCQPFSVAGQRAGTDDPRHLWPDFHRLIRAVRPAVVMGEQVAGKAGRNWFNGVRTDLAGSSYLGRAVDIPACAVDAPHERNRLYWIAMAHPDVAELRYEPSAWKQSEQQPNARISRGHIYVGHGQGDAVRAGLCESGSQFDWLEPANAARRNGSWWADAATIVCSDGKARRTKSGLPLLVDGLPGRLGLWRLAGNAISPVLAAEVIGAFLDCEVAA